MLCFVALVAVMATVIYGFFLRALWAHSYFIAVLLGIFGAMTILIGLAQQAIAARDAATWRSMAEWQIRAARSRIAGGVGDLTSSTDEKLDADSPDYYEHLVEALLDDVQRRDEEAFPS